MMILNAGDYTAAVDQPRVIMTESHYWQNCYEYERVFTGVINFSLTPLETLETHTMIIRIMF